MNMRENLAAFWNSAMEGKVVKETPRSYFALPSTWFQWIWACRRRAWLRHIGAMRFCGRSVATLLPPA
jgi:hypothetical protein